MGFKNNSSFISKKSIAGSASSNRGKRKFPNEESYQKQLEEQLHKLAYEKVMPAAHASDVRSWIQVYKKGLTEKFIRK
jgi:hypothetical protein